MAQQHRPDGGVADSEQPAGAEPGQARTEPSSGASPGATGEQTSDNDDSLLTQLTQERTRAAEYLEQAQRSRAELINYRRRMEQEMQQVREHAGERLLTRILPVFDDFHRALEAVPAEQAGDSWVQGVRLIERKLWSILEAEGVRPIEAAGRPFDPSLHEAVTVEEGDGDADTVVQEFQRGYTLHDRVLRPAMVKVGSGHGQAANGR